MTQYRDVVTLGVAAMSMTQHEISIKRRNVA